MIKALFVYPTEQRWYEYYDREFFSDRAIKFYVTGDQLVVNQSTSMEKVGLQYEAKYRSEFLRKLFGGLVRLEETIRDLSPDLVLTKELHSPTTYRVSKIGGNFKHIVISDETIPPNKSIYGKFPVTRYYFNYNCRKTRYFIFISNKSKESLLPYCLMARKSIIVYPPIAPKIDFQYERNEDKTFTFSFIGNVSKNKGVKTLLRSILILPSLTNKRFILKLAGEGSLSVYVRSMADKYDQIEYLGYVSEEEKESLLKSTDVFVYPSEDINFLGMKRWEEQGAISAMEAMAFGIPVIGTDSGSIPEIIRDSRVISKQNNPYELAGKMRLLLENENLRKEIGMNNKKWIQNNYSNISDARMVNNFLRDVAEDN